MAAGRTTCLTPRWFQTMLGRLSASEMPPAAQLVAQRRACWRRPQRRHWLGRRAVLVAVGLQCAVGPAVVACGSAGGVYRTAIARCTRQRPCAPPPSPRRLDRPLAPAGVAGVLGPRCGCLILKDLRLFRRDPVQWSQFLIFFGLLTLYFVNIHRFSYDANYVAWVNMISFLNLAVVGLILSTFTTRFIFPMISLEGRRFWILGLVPVSRETHPLEQVPVRRRQARWSLARC